MSWMCIKTADTKSQRDVILYNGKKVFAGWHSSDGWHDSSNGEHADAPERPQPTHWMPFPEPPSR